jgi:tyrosine-specific transport protein
MKAQNQQSIPIWGGIALVAGTCIGGGMLALPVETAEAGFLPAFVGLFIAWIYMLLTGLLLVEATLWVKKPHPHLVSLSSQFLGSPGRFLSILLVLFMGLGSLVAYVTAGAPLIGKFLKYSFGFLVSPSASLLIFSILFGAIFLFKENKVSKLNHYLVLGLILSFALILVIGGSSFKSLPLKADFSKIPFTLPLILTTFSYQIMVPSLVELLHKDRRSLFKAVFLGSLIPLLVYLAYETVVLGIVPYEGEMGLKYALNKGLSSTEVLYFHTQSSLLAPIVDTFAFLSLGTSFIGIGFGLVGFLRDLFSLKETKHTLFGITFLILSVTLFLCYSIPNAFLTALDLTGGYGDTWLSGLIPIGMCWVGRYIQGIREGSSALMKKWVLILLSSFSFYVIYIQSLKLIQG